jgi:hypothetical protein
MEILIASCIIVFQHIAYKRCVVCPSAFGYMSIGAAHLVACCAALLLLLQAGVVASGDAIVSIPSALVALCLNSTGLRRVRELAVLNVLVDVFTFKRTMRVLTSDTPAILGSGLEELLRCDSAAAAVLVQQCPCKPQQHVVLACGW